MHSSGLDAMRYALNSSEAQRNLLKKQQRQFKKELKDQRDLVLDIKKALAIVTEAGEETQKAFGEQLSSLVTSAIQIVMVEDHYEFEVRFDTKRNATSVSFHLFKNKEEQDLKVGTGGGVLDIIQIALRFAMYSMKRPRSRNLILLDEPTKCLRGMDNIGRVYEMIDKISKGLGLQIIMVSSANETLDFADRYNIIELVNEDGVVGVRGM